MRKIALLLLLLPLCGMTGAQVRLNIDASEARTMKPSELQRAPAGTVVSTVYYSNAEQEQPKNIRVSDINKLFPVKENGRWGLADIEGNYAIAPFYEAMRAVSENRIAVKSRGKWGYLNRKGLLDIPCVYDDAAQFKNGYALVRQSGKWGLLDSNGKTCIICQYDTLRQPVEGMVAAYTESAWGFLNTAGSLEIPFAYEAVSDFHQDKAAFRINGNGE